MLSQNLLVGNITVNIQAQLTIVKAEAAKLGPVVVNQGREEFPVFLTVCGPCNEVTKLLTFANELVPQFPQVTVQPRAPRYEYSFDSP